MISHAEIDAAITALRYGAVAVPIQLERTNFNSSDVWLKAWRSLEFRWKDRDVVFEEEIAEVL